MTIEEAAKKLDDCANGKCTDCQFRHFDVNVCQSYNIKYIANKCKEIAERMNDDGK